DELLVLAGAQRGDDQRLGLAAREQRRPVRARQDADLRHDRANRLDIAAVDAPPGVEDGVSHYLGLELLEDAGNAKLVISRLVGPLGEEVSDHPGLGGIDRLVALLLARNPIG